ncbi:hypothetical protein IF2G_08009 [Cordyceps javanica]|nr:hypothetical protein IF2G_08009 [Cordyceps javanica]
MQKGCNLSASYQDPVPAKRVAKIKAALHCTAPQYPSLGPFAITKPDSICILRQLHTCPSLHPSIYPASNHFTTPQTTITSASPLLSFSPSRSLTHRLTRLHSLSLYGTSYMVPITSNLSSSSLSNHLSSFGPDAFSSGDLDP